LSDDNYNKIDWDIEPINCAFMYFNSKDLVNTWYAWAEGVINTTFYKTPLENNRDTIFIEQRLLPAIANTLKLKIDTLLPNVYLQYIEFNDEVGERTGSWKGGTLGCGYNLLPNETPLECLRRMEKERKF
jgi:hypothetical protein